MSDTTANWGEVGSKVTDLGRTLRTHFEQQRNATAPAASGAGPETARDGDPAPNAGPAGDGGAAEDGGAAGDGDRVHEALRKLGDAVDGVVDALGSAVKDPTIKEDVKQVGSALTGALSASFATISDDLRQAFRRMSNQQQDPTTPTGTTEAEDPRSP